MDSFLYWTRISMNSTWNLAKLCHSSCLNSLKWVYIYILFPKISALSCCTTLFAVEAKKISQRGGFNLPSLKVSFLLLGIVKSTTATARKCNCNWVWTVCAACTICASNKERHELSTWEKCNGYWTWTIHIFQRHSSILFSATHTILD